MKKERMVTEAAVFFLSYHKYAICTFLFCLASSRKQLKRAILLSVICEFLIHRNKNSDYFIHEADTSN